MEEQPRLVVLYATCTLNKSFLSPYNPDIPFTTGLSRFADDALVFERHQTETGASGVAFASIFSGCQADRHGVIFHPHSLPDSLLLHHEAFAAAGFETHYWSTHSMAAAELNYAQGVDESRGHDRLLTASDADFNAILERLRSDPSARVLITTAFTETHAPYVPYRMEGFCNSYPEHCRAWRTTDRDTRDRLVSLYTKNHWRLSYDHDNTVRALGLTAGDAELLARLLEEAYAARVAALDGLFGRMTERIRQAGLWDESLIVFTADHGEVLDRANAPFKWVHAWPLPPESLAVPLLIVGRGAGVTPGRYEAVTRSIDVFPTLASLAGVALPEDDGPCGVDLGPAIRGSVPEPELVAFSHTPALVPFYAERSSHWRKFRELFPTADASSIWVGMREHDTMWKLEHAGDGSWKCRSFDLAADPAEARNLCDESDPEHRKSLEKLQAYRERLVRAFESTRATASDLGEEDRIERLRSLGYIE